MKKEVCPHCWGEKGFYLVDGKVKKWVVCSKCKGEGEIKCASQ